MCGSARSLRLSAVAQPSEAERSVVTTVVGVPSGDDVAPQLIVEVHVLVDKAYVLFVWQKSRVQTGNQS